MSLVVQIVVGTPEEISSGQGDSAVTALQAAVRLGVSIAGMRAMIKSGQLVSCAQFGKTQLFRERDVERLRATRG